MKKINYLIAAALVGATAASAVPFTASADEYVYGTMDIPYEDYEKAYDIMFSPEATDEERSAAAEIMSRIPLEKTAEADYVWLPIRFDGDNVRIDWYDEWRTEDFE